VLTPSALFDTVDRNAAQMTVISDAYAGRHLGNAYRTADSDDCG
jgi:hypothetical protein